MSVTSCQTPHPCQSPHVCHVTFMPENHVFMSVTLYLSLTVSYLISMDGHLISLVSHGLVSMVSWFLSSCPYKSPYIHDLLLHVLMSMISCFMSCPWPVTSCPCPVASCPLVASCPWSVTSCPLVASCHVHGQSPHVHVQSPHVH